MKKFIIILLLILPVFLMVTISIAGRIFSYLSYISVERVAIVNNLEEDVESIKINKDETYTLTVKVYPELANNKSVKYISIDETIATVDQNGVITGINYGFTTIIVQSVDNGTTDKVTVNVSNENVESIDIDINEKTIYLYQTYTLSATVYPSTALNKNIIWSSSDPTYVSVDANGKLTANKITAEGQTITITATTEDGNKTDSCEITVIAHLLAFKPQITENSTIYVSNQINLNLMDLIVYDSEKINEQDIQFKILGGKKYASITENQLSFNTETPGFEGQYIIIKAYVDNSSTQVELEFTVRYLSEA